MTMESSGRLSCSLRVFGAFRDGAGFIFYDGFMFTVGLEALLTENNNFHT
jgi:hypothetical protein